MPSLPTPSSNPKLPEQVYTADSQGAAVARGNQELARSVTGVGEALIQRTTQREISALNAEFAKAQAELTVEWQDTLSKADPNDPEVASRFRKERVDSRLNELKGKASTREAKDYYTRLSSGLGANFLVTTEAGMSKLEETAAVQSWQTQLNQMGDALSADPLSFDTTLPIIDMQLEGLVQSRGLSREQALRLRTDALESAAIAAATGRIEQNVDEGVAYIESGGYSEYISPQQKNSLLLYGNSLKASQEAAAKRARAELADATAIEYMKAATNPDGSINAAAIPQLQARLFRDGAVSGDRETTFATWGMLNRLVDEGSAGKVNVPAVQAEVLRRASLPPGDPDRITMEEAQNGVGRGYDFSFLNNQIVPTLTRAASADGRSQNDRIDNHLKAVKSQLGLSDSMFAAFTNSPRAQKAYSAYNEWFNIEYQRQLEAGKNASDLLNPASPDYLGRSLEQFIPPSSGAELPTPDMPASAINLDPEFRRVNFKPASGKMRSPEELDKLLNEGE